MRGVGVNTNKNSCHIIIIGILWKEEVSSEKAGMKASAKPETLMKSV
jgi:hypothetical protein